MLRPCLDSSIAYFSNRSSSASAELAPAIECIRTCIIISFSLLLASSCCIFMAIYICLIVSSISCPPPFSSGRLLPDLCFFCSFCFFSSSSISEILDLISKFFFLRFKITCRCYSMFWSLAFTICNWLINIKIRSETTNKISIENLP